ncbi:DUF6194 family protein [Haliangium ochraceum]|uniref:DUF6194 domain-containing protein n=1 Tax=Haliangium ochraceum (strain DSM 14365 / JCM 11303 / SMP-2) TaxID=502025 RepID=D0LUX5_HALO1|nr:DUF6194 family protein [Haliangium ochraceum]ACY14015.1 hypothetical protein Hoch_1462 [Haliangium ochraceum DSM 14365]
MTEDEIRRLLSGSPSVQVQVATCGDGSPEMAWGDTFFFTRDEHGMARKMPFATIVTKDYRGFDMASKLDRGGLFRLNIELGREAFTELFGFAPRELEKRRGDIDYAALDIWFPHPIYGAQGWSSIINPSSASAERAKALLALARERSLKRGG